MNLPSLQQQLKLIEQKLQNKLAVGMKTVGKFTEEKVKNHIDTDVYGAGQPNEYNRTLELRESVKSSEPIVTNNSVSVEVKNDSNLIHSEPENFIHGSLYYSPNDASSYVAELVHEGTSGPLFGDGYWRKKRPFMDNARNELIQTGEHIRVLKKSLIMQGLNVK